MLPNNNNEHSATPDIFNRDEYARKLDNHDTELVAVKTRLVNLEEKFGTHEKIAETLFETATKQIKMEEMFAIVFQKLVEKDPKIKCAIEDVVKKVDRAVVKAFWGKFGFTVWTALVFIAGLLVKGMIEHFFK